MPLVHKALVHAPLSRCHRRLQKSRHWPIFLRDAALSYEHGKYEITVALCNVILRLDPGNDRAIRLRDTTMTLLRERCLMH